MPERREGKAFEPPPWELEQFERLARERGPAQAEDELDLALKGLEQVVQEPAAQKDPAPVAVVTAPGKPAAEQAAQLDEARVIEMLAQLSAEEPRPIEDMWRMGLIAAAITGAIGIMLVVFGVVGLAKVAKAGPMGIYIASILLVFGAGFCALAAWTAVRTLKQRGVL